MQFSVLIFNPPASSSGSRLIKSGLIVTFCWNHIYIITCFCRTIRFAMSADRELNTDASDDNKLVSDAHLFTGSHCFLVDSTLPVCASRSGRRWSSRVCCDMQEPLKMFWPWRRYADLQSFLLSPSRQCFAPPMMHLWRSPRRWCSTWVSTSSRSSCTTRSSSTSSTAPRMHWGGFWAWTASLLKSRGEISISRRRFVRSCSVKTAC